MMLVKYAQGFVIFPGGFGTVDELFESLTLIQTGKVQSFPVVLYGSAYFRGLLDWLSETMLRAGKIAEADLSLLHVVDTPEEACDRILRGVAGHPHQQKREAEARAVTRGVLKQPGAPSPPPSQAQASRVRRGRSPRIR